MKRLHGTPGPPSLILGCALLLSACLVAAPAEISPEKAAKLEAVIRTSMEENKVVGLQVAVGMGTELVWNKGYGKADLEQDAPVTPTTLFRTASISKWLTAAAALRLVEKAKLDLDAEIQRYCPEYPKKQWTITTRHLLQHRAGVRHYWGANGEPRDTAEQREELRRKSDEERLWMSVRYTDVLRPLDRFKDDPLLFEPGTKFQYTSNGYRLLGCVLQGAAGQSYNELMEEAVLGPSGMKSTRTDDAQAVVPGRARGYTRARNGDLQRSRFRDVSENLPAGGHLSTAADLVRFALAFHNGRLVSAESRKSMMALPSGSENADAWYGFGISVQEAGGPDKELLLSHGGGQDETRTLLTLLPGKGIAVATMTNYEPFGNHQPLHHKILEVLVDK